MKKEIKGKEVTIKGFVTPEEWDNDDNVIAIGISTDDDDYVVELNKMGEELFDFLDDDVEVNGIVREGKDGTKHIRITGYEVLSMDEDDEEDDEDSGYDDDYDDPDFEHDRVH
jgi:uncharacterized membrane protein YcgQ (UPF0703/DUF1980 family)